MYEKSASRRVLLERQSRIYLPGGSGSPAQAELARACAIELAQLAYLPSRELLAQMGSLSVEDLTELHTWLWSVLSERLGANHKHVPLFRSFPDGIPEDTGQLWWRKVLVHFVQAEGQPCIFCGRLGTTHVLRPCQHVVCDKCFDGSSYSACPVCEHHVDTRSPFFTREDPRVAVVQSQPLRFRLLTPGTELEADCKALFLSFCSRQQAMSETDKHDLKALAQDWAASLPAWLPPRIAVRENLAIILAELLVITSPAEFAALAEPYLNSSTDVLRLLAAASGADPSLAGAMVFREEMKEFPHHPVFAALRSFFQPTEPPVQFVKVRKSCRIFRFKVAKMPRPRRRMLLGLLERFDAEALVEDMLRHSSYWIWLGEFLHPHEYAERFPKTARAFAVLRGKAPDGSPAPSFQSYYSRLESCSAQKDAEGFIRILSERPGELGRRLDHALRLCAGQSAQEESLLTLFESRLPQFSSPLLLALNGLLRNRDKVSARRVFWPRGAASRGVYRDGALPTLDKGLLERICGRIESELLRRFGLHGSLGSLILDEDLSSIVAPFNERSASPAAVNLPRGSMLPLPAGRLMRMFLHWCQPERGHEATDLDLSVGFYNEKWEYAGVCSYYQLSYDEGGKSIAKSAGDLRDAPWPDGASEFVDLDLESARERGLRFAVMVVNAYAGLPFDSLERAFAGLMLRESAEGQHFEPQAVELRFSLRGSSGVYLPMVIDLEKRRMHWLDIYSKGQLAMNNVATSNSAITTICPLQIDYFSKGYRPSLLELGLLHAAARAEQVLVRGEAGSKLFRRQANESPAALLARLKAGQADEEVGGLPLLADKPLMALLLRGDVELPQGSRCYALFNEKAQANMEASELIV